MRDDEEMKEKELRAEEEGVRLKERALKEAERGRKHVLSEEEDETDENEEEEDEDEGMKGKLRTLDMILCWCDGEPLNAVSPIGHSHQRVRIY